MDVFGTIVSAIGLVSKLIGYLQAVKGAKEDRQKLLSEVSALGALLDVLRSRLSPSADGNSDSILDKLVKAGIVSPLRMCLGALGSIVGNPESLIPSMNVGTSLPTKIKEKMRDLKWPLHKTEIEETLSSIERLKTLILLALQTSLVEFVEKAHGELVTMGLDVKEIKSAVSLLEANQRAYMKEIESGFEDLGTKLQHTMSKMENAIVDRVTAVQGSIADNMAEVEKIAAKIDRIQKGQERQDVLKWLSQFAPNFDQKRANTFEKRTAGTGKWFLEHSTFEAWQRGEYNVLWCPGNPGAGKSVMTSVIIDHLQKGIADDTAVVFIYFDYTRAEEYKLQQLVEALLSQFVQRNMSTLNMQSLQKHKKGNRPALDELWTILEAEVETYAQVFVVIDALDEADSTTWIPLLRRLRKLAKIKILATSRDLGNIATEFQELEDQRLDIISNEGDLKAYIEGSISNGTGSFEKMVKRDPSLRAEIITGVVEKAGGMFLLAQLHMDALKTKSNVVNLRRALGELPGNLKSTYDVAMGRISNEGKPLAFRILSWVIRAARPMKIDDLQYALAIELDDSKGGITSIDTDCLDDSDHLMSVCVGLVIQRHEQSYWGGKNIYVELVHYTTQDYLREHVFDTRLPRHPVDPAHLATTCLKYFAFDVFNGPLDWDSKQKLMDTPFAKYAIYHWGRHVHEHHDDPTVRQLAMGLLHNDQKVAALGFLTFHTQGVSAIQICAHSGLKDNLIRLLDDGPDVDSKDSYGNTSLIVAANRGHEGILQLLLEQGADANAKTSNGNTALLAAAYRGHRGILQLLLTQGGVDVNAKDRDGSTALIIAANRGHEGFLELLLEQGVDVNAKDSSGNTLLIIAANRSHKEILQLLLKQEGVDVNAKDRDDNTALIIAANHGHEGILELLLAQKGVDVNARGSDGNTALTAAAERGHEGIVRLLVRQEGVALNAKDSRGNTAFVIAANHGHEGILQLLFKQGADVNAKDSHGDITLIAAVSRNHEGIVQLLLKQGVDVNVKGSDGDAALMVAAKRGCEGILKLLLKQEGVDVNVKDPRGDTALTTAASHNREGIVQLLLKQEGVDVNAQGSGGIAPLIRAVVSGNQRIVELLLARDGVNINLQYEKGYTPLALAIRGGNEAIVQMLLARDDLDINLTESHGNTYLTLAAQHNRNDCIAKLLLDKGGIDINSRNTEGEVALAVAASQGHDAVVKILLAQADIDINAMDLRGRTPLDQTSTPRQPKRGPFDLPIPPLERPLDLTNTIKLLRAAGACTGVELGAELKAGGAPI